MTNNLPNKKQISLNRMESPSSLVLLFDRIFKENHANHLLIASEKNLKKIISFLNFKKVKWPWYELPPFPKSKSAYLEFAIRKRKKWQTWAQFSISHSSRLFLASPQALLKKTDGSLKHSVLKKGEQLDLSLFSDYKETDFVERVGEFSSRGFLVDVFSPAYDRPLRFQLLGNQIESIHLLSSDFKRREKDRDQAVISSLSEWNLKGDAKKKLCEHFRKEEKKMQASFSVDFFKHVSRGLSCFGLESLLNALSEDCSLDFFSDSPVVWFFEPENALAEFKNHKLQLEKEYTFFTEHNLFLPWERISSLKSEAWIDIGPSRPFKTLVKEADFSFFTENQKQILKNFSSSLFKRSKNFKEQLFQIPVSDFIFVESSPGKLKSFLQKENILNSEDLDFYKGKNFLFVNGLIKESFFCKGDEAYFRSEDLIPESQPSLSRFDFFRQKAKALEFSKLEVGDLLVHRQYGVGRFEGLETLKRKGYKEDFLVLKYRNEDKLLIPAYKSIYVKKYSHRRSESMTKSLLDSLGNTKPWEKKKQKAKKYIQSLAIELMDLYRERRQKKRKAFRPVKSFEAFSSGFPFEETKDQKQAIQDVMSDMDREQPMDRLLTADTGFGKTEVALRACYRALENGFQVCFLAPTTVLSLQHFENFKKRFDKTPFRLALLNRFVTHREKEKLFQSIKQGELDFLIATHSVFSPSLSFKNLGLLVLDEEHRFGVRQKERLFRFRKSLDVLSLSATPIPRTLNMSLTGVKDISIISQPPAQRKSVQIILKSWEDGILSFIKKACHKERDRGGQVLFVHNRIKSLYQRAEQIQKLLPDFKMAVAHGKTPQLDRVILDFFEKKYDILLSTNIIESGMDIPKANSLFLDRAHEMGLSQIYQLKGRVGRGVDQAFCYLLFPSKDGLSALARERLSLLEKYAGLGESFQLALRDLENRGSGSLFGAEQSGHMQSLGDDLYFEILNEQLTNQKETFIEPEILLPFSSGIPESYISDPRLRLLYYKSLSTAFTKQERQLIEQELKEDFGAFPEELKNLFFLLEIRHRCKTLLISHFKGSFKQVSLTFHPETPVSPEHLLKVLYDRGGTLISDKTCQIPLKEHGFLTEIENILKSLKID